MSILFMRLIYILFRLIWIFAAETLHAPRCFHHVVILFLIGRIFARLASLSWAPRPPSLSLRPLLWRQLRSFSLQRLPRLSWSWASLRSQNAWITLMRFTTHPYISALLVSLVNIWSVLSWSLPETLSRHRLVRLDLTVRVADSLRPWVNWAQ